MIEIVNVSSRGQIVIPEKVRKHFGIRQGSRLILIEKNDTLVLSKEDSISPMLAHAQKEEAGWLALAEQSMRELWDNPQDDETWSRYLDDKAA